MTPMPRNIDEAWAYLGAITAEQWANFRLGALTVLVVAGFIGLGIYLWRTR